MPDIKMTLKAEIPQRSGYTMTRAQEDEIKARLLNTDIADYVKNTVGWDYIDDVPLTVVMFQEI